MSDVIIDDVIHHCVSVGLTVIGCDRPRVDGLHSENLKIERQTDRRAYRHRGIYYIYMDTQSCISRYTDISASLSVCLSV